MKILIIGGGGREHALAWKAAQSNKVDTVYVAPGNAGTAKENNITNINIAADDIPALQQFAQHNKIDLTIVGPEAPLVGGIVDSFQACDLKIFGPSAAAAQLEGSKAFTKDFLKRHQIPTADYAVFSQIDEALAYLQQQQLPIVIKADGLAAGKGVIIAHTLEIATNAVRDMLADNKFGDAGHRVVIEEFLSGEEASFICMVDGKHILPMASSQDHKARDNGDQGPNTGGMGAYSPAPVVDQKMHDRIIEQVIRPTVDGMQQEDASFCGFLYAGIMVADNGDIKVLEYNVRFGDPETQPILMRLKSDLVELCLAATNGSLDQVSIEWDPRPALGVVLAAGGYPNEYRKLDTISGLDEAESDNCKVFHAGTQLDENDNAVTNGGRVLCVTALGESVSEAQKCAYANVQKIHWDDVFYRTDIGYRAVQRESSQ